MNGVHWRNGAHSGRGRRDGSGPAARGMAWIALALVLASCTPPEGTRGESGIALTWEHAQVFLPARLVAPGAPHPRAVMRTPYIQEIIASRAPGTRLPVVLYLHGCAGLFEIGSIGDFFAARGYGVIAPDSFANAHRPPPCNVKTRRAGGGWQNVQRLRQQEIRYAVHRLRELPWVDGNRMYLFGISQGGRAATLYAGDEFRGHIALDTHCAGPNQSHTLHMPRTIPLLAIMAKHDPWYTGRGAAPRCRVGDRPHSRSLVLDTTIHGVFTFSRTRREIHDFMRRTGGL